MAYRQSVPFPEYNLTLMFRQWNNAVGVVDVEEIKKRDRWIDVRNFVRAEDGSKITYELWLVHRHSGREVKMGDCKEEKGSFSMRGQWGQTPFFCLYPIRHNQFLKKYFKANGFFMTEFDSAKLGREVGAENIHAKERKRTERNRAVLMALHPRLGAAAGINVLDDGLLDKILDYCYLSELVYYWDDHSDE